MQKFIKILKRIIFLPYFLTLLIAIPSFALVIYVLISDSSSVLSYISYGLSAYALTISCTLVYRIIIDVRTHGGVANLPISQKVIETRLGKKFYEDKDFRAEVSLYRGFLFNFLYVILKVGSGIYYSSVWLISLGIYYFLLAVMRFLLLRYVNKNSFGKNVLKEFYRYRACGIILLLMNQALAVISALMFYRNEGYEYPGLLVYAMAAYTFYTFTLAIVNFIKYRKNKSPVMSAAKAINLVSAIVSMLALETAMLSQFGEDEGFRSLMVSLTGIGVCAVVLVIAIYMIVVSSIKINDIKKKGFNNGKQQ